MELEFERPIVPNFIRTKQGNFALKDIDDEEIERYIKVFSERLYDRRKEQKNDHLNNTKNG